MARQKKNVVETVQKEFPEFAAVVESLGVQELEMKLASYAKENEKVIDAQEADESLQSAKGHASELQGPYTDAKKAIRLKSRYLISLIRDRGGDA